MKNIDLDFNFFNDLYGKTFTIDSVVTERKQRPIITYYIFNEKYRDPDGESKKLYQYHKIVWNCSLPNGIQFKTIDSDRYKNLWKINVDGKNFFLGSDYIGFSKNWITKDISDEDVGKGLFVTRCIAGHMLWCKGFTKGWYKSGNKFEYSASFRKDFITINQAKGGRRGVFDRIDWTLKLLKSYFSFIDNNDFKKRKLLFMQDESVKKLLDYKDLTDDEKKAVVERSSKRYQFNPEQSVDILFYAFENSREWLMLFVNFLQFIEYFALDDLIDEDKNVKALAPWLPVLPDEYKQYMENSIEFTLLRKIRLKSLVK